VAGGIHQQFGRQAAGELIGVFQHQLLEAVHIGELLPAGQLRASKKDGTSDNGSPLVATRSA
jgi:hypothetical protein